MFESNSSLAVSTATVDVHDLASFTPPCLCLTHWERCGSAPNVYRRMGSRKTEAVIGWCVSRKPAPVTTPSRDTAFILEGRDHGFGRRRDWRSLYIHEINCTTTGSFFVWFTLENEPRMTISWVDVPCIIVMSCSWKAQLFAYLASILQPHC